jgi:hypothetical protein
VGGSVGGLPDAAVNYVVLPTSKPSSLNTAITGTMKSADIKAACNERSDYFSAEDIWLLDLSQGDLDGLINCDEVDNVRGIIFINTVNDLSSVPTVLRPVNLTIPGN